MKKAFIIMCLGAALAGCTKTGTEPQEPARGGEIMLAVGGDSFDVQVTKATAINAVPASLYWSATTGTVGSSEATKWGSASATLSSGKVPTGKYQTNPATTYNYYLSNVAITFAATGSTISASNGTDVLAGKVSSSSTTPSVELQHVFARTGTLSAASADASYAISNVSWKISGPGTAGTYNIATGAWSGLTALAETALASGGDMYLVPGNYTLKCTYTLTIGDNVQTLTKSATVTLAGGQINNITATMPVNAVSPIQITVTLAPWTNNNISIGAGQWS